MNIFHLNAVHIIAEPNFVSFYDDGGELFRVLMDGTISFNLKRENFTCAADYLQSFLSILDRSFAEQSELNK